MKIKTLLSMMMLAASVATISCEKGSDEGQRETNFDVPPLTEDNTIQFTVDAGNELTLQLLGGKIAVDWGDGLVEKDINPQNDRTMFRHTYAAAGQYRVKVWITELNDFTLYYNSVNSYSNFTLGESSTLRWLDIGTNGTDVSSFTATETVDISGCPALGFVGLNSFLELRSFDPSVCPDLGGLVLIASPLIETLDLSHNGKLVNFAIAGNTRLTELNLEGCTNLEHIDITDTTLEELDFAAFPRLRDIRCSNSGLKSVNVSGNPNLASLMCAGLGLASLDISNNPLLTALYADNNNLTTLDVSKNQAFRFLYFAQNSLGKDILETIFSELPPDPEYNNTPATRESPVYEHRPSTITISYNPGAASCDTKIITDKGWRVY
jgi:hypothetical protein